MGITPKAPLMSKAPLDQALTEQVGGLSDYSNYLIVKSDEDAKPSDRFEGSTEAYYEMAALDKGMPGDKYRISLQVAGKYRQVSWEKIAGTAVAGKGDYYLVSNWNGWRPQKMDCDKDGKFSIETQLTREGGEFQILRDGDWHQAIYPVDPAGGMDVLGAGPDRSTGCRGVNWFLNGAAGDVYNIEFTRESSDEYAEDYGIDTVDVKKVSWSKLRTEEVPKELAGQPRFSVVGSWDGWNTQREAHWNGSTHHFFVAIGKDKFESFQVLQDLSWNRVFHPWTRHSGPDMQGIRGPTPIGYTDEDACWTIRGEEGQVFEVRLMTTGFQLRGVSWNQRSIDAEVQGALQAGYGFMHQ